MPYELNDLFLSGPTPLVNNAAIAHPRKLEEITEAEWDEVLAVNLKVGVLGDTGGGWRYATKKVGTHHQPVFSRRPDGRGSGSALRRVQGGDYIIGLTHSTFIPQRSYAESAGACCHCDSEEIVIVHFYLRHVQLTGQRRTSWVQRFSRPHRQHPFT